MSSRFLEAPRLLESTPSYDEDFINMLTNDPEERRELQKLSKLSSEEKWLYLIAKFKGISTKVAKIEKLINDKNIDPITSVRGYNTAARNFVDIVLLDPLSYKTNYNDILSLGDEFINYLKNLSLIEDEDVGGKTKKELYFSLNAVFAKRKTELRRRIIGRENLIGFASLNKYTKHIYGSQYNQFQNVLSLCMVKSALFRSIRFQLSGAEHYNDLTDNDKRKILQNENILEGNYFWEKIQEHMTIYQNFSEIVYESQKKALFAQMKDVLLNDFFNFPIDHSEIPDDIKEAVFNKTEIDHSKLQEKRNTYDFLQPLFSSEIEQPNSLSSFIEDKENIQEDEYDDDDDDDDDIEDDDDYDDDDDDDDALNTLQEALRPRLAYRLLSKKKKNSFSTGVSNTSKLRASRDLTPNSSPEKGRKKKRERN